MKKDTLHPIHRFYYQAANKSIISTTTIKSTFSLTQLKQPPNHLGSVIEALNTIGETKLHENFFNEYGDALKNMESATPQELSYRVDVHFVDLNGIMSGVRHPYSESDGLIKYSKKEHSPVSSKPSDLLQLGTPALYESHEKDSGLVKDNSECKYKENLDWWKRGSEEMEVIRKSIPGSSFNTEDQLALDVTWENRDDFWLYCTSIDPKLNYEREEQMRKTAPEYDFMTKIENPTAFAKQLGHDFGKQIESGEDLKCNNLGLYTLFSTLSKLHGRGSGFFILVEHGPVIYLDREEKQEFMNYASERTDLPIMLFVKDLKYELQQEYRFIIKAAVHSPKDDKFYMKVSEDLRKLMLPV